MDATPDADDRDIRRTDGTRSPAEPTRTTAAMPASGATTGTTADTTASTTPVHDDRPRVVLDSSLDGHQKQGVSGGTWIALILGALILVLLLIFILQNNVPADFAYLGFEFSLPLGVAMLFAAIAGVLVAALLGSIRLIKLSRRVRKLEAERESIKRALR
ncbi:LapA family protein [Agrococcus sediminis]|uniref:LapA family protein n=1 Tax=Agrococcus sediminis TaxID=2599924 RepID=UPI0034121BB3